MRIMSEDLIRMMSGRYMCVVLLLTIGSSSYCPFQYMKYFADVCVHQSRPGEGGRNHYIVY